LAVDREEEIVTNSLSLEQIEESIPEVVFFLVALAGCGKMSQAA